MMFIQLHRQEDGQVFGVEKHGEDEYQAIFPDQLADYSYPFDNVHTAIRYVLARVDKGRDANSAYDFIECVLYSGHGEILSFEFAWRWVVSDDDVPLHDSLGCYLNGGEL